MKPLIDDDFLSRLARVRFITTGRRSGKLSGVHHSSRAGISLEFADYREYVPGDDFRYIDWNVYGRLGRILVKTFVREVDLPIYLLLDLSGSMRLGTPPKVRYAARLAVALAYMGLRGLDRVGLYAFSDQLLPLVRPRHGMRQMSRLVHELQEVTPTGTTSVDAALAEFVAGSRESGLVLIISDLLSPGGYQQGLSRLLYRGDQVVVLQVMAPEELEPEVEGAVRLEDVETGKGLFIDVGGRTRAQYGQRLEEYMNEMARYLAHRQVPRLLIPTDRPLDAVLHRDLRRLGVVR